MIHFMNFLALVVGGMEAIQPAVAGVLAGRSTGTFLFNAVQRRQSTPPPVPPACADICSQVSSVIANLNTCTIETCCTNDFEMSFFNCLTCVESAVNVTDFTKDQALLDELYDNCAALGVQLQPLIFPGQSTNQPLSPVVTPTSSGSASQVTVTGVSSGSAITQSNVQSTVGPSGSSGTTAAPSQTTGTASSSTPTPTTSSSFGIRSAEISRFNLFVVAVMLGTWSLYFGVL